MSGRRIAEDHVRELVTARLGRAPQDVLEAAVVLEAWAGVRPDVALRSAHAAIAPLSPEPAVSRAATTQRYVRERGALAEGVALLLSVVAVALWTTPFSRALGADVWGAAVRIALPVTLGAQWALRSRYLARRDGLAVLKADWRVAAVAAAVLSGSLIALGPREHVAGLLIATWVAGTIMIRRNWAGWYAGCLVAVCVLVNRGADPLSTLIALTAVTSLVALVALRMSGCGRDSPGRGQRAGAAALMGAGIGLLLVADDSVAWAGGGALPALALIPSTIGSLWGAYHLWRMHDEVPRALAGVPVTQTEQVTLRGPAMRVLASAVVRLVGVTAVLSAAVLLLASWTSGTTPARGGVEAAAARAGGDVVEAAGVGAVGSVTSHGHVSRADGSDRVGDSAPSARSAPRAGQVALLVGFGFVALATLLISLLHSLGYSSWGIVSIASGLGAELAFVTLDVPVGGAGLLSGAVIAAIVALIPAVLLFLRPGRVLATKIWIT